LQRVVGGRVGKKKISKASSFSPASGEGKRRGEEERALLSSDSLQSRSTPRNGGGKGGKRGKENALYSISSLRRASTEP